MALFELLALVLCLGLAPLNPPLIMTLVLPLSLRLLQALIDLGRAKSLNSLRCVVEVERSKRCTKHAAVNAVATRLDFFQSLGASMLYFINAIVFADKAQRGVCKRRKMCG